MADDGAIRDGFFLRSWWRGGGVDAGASDPARAGQWYLDALGPLPPIWPPYQGATIAVMGNGAADAGQSLSQDVWPNLLPARDFSFAGLSYPSRATQGDVAQAAEMIGAVAGNGIGGAGVAPRAGLSLLDLGAGAARAERLAALSWAKGFDIVLQLAPLTAAGPQEGAGIAALATSGRGGRGSLHVAPASDAAHANSLQVAAVDRLGNAVADTASGGGHHAPLVAAYDAAGATDLAPDAAAAAQVAGIVAAIMGANPRLGWRDVQDILALTARHTGSALGAGAGGYEAGPWHITQAEANGGLGLRYHPSYGFGLVDAAAAIRLAQSFATLRQTPQTSANQRCAVQVDNAAQPIADAVFSPFTGQTATGVTERVFQGEAGMRLESVVVTVTLTHSYADDLALFLIAPDGTRFALTLPLDEAAAIAGGWTGYFRIAGVLGMNAAGDWRIRAEDLSPMDTGTLGPVRIDFYGRAAGGPQIVTDQIFDLIAAGGQGTTVMPQPDQTLNLAALSTAVSVAAGMGGQVTAGGQVILTLGGDYATYHLTDRNDHFAGSASAAMVLGAGGNDTLLGGGGDDRFYGGEGRDALSGGAGRDVLDGGNGADQIRGDGAADTLYGGAGDDALFGGAGDDAIWGGAGRDTLWGDAGADTLGGGEGADIFVFARGSGDDRMANISASQGDLLYLDAGLFANGPDWAQVRASATAIDGGFTYDFGAGDRLTILGQISRLELESRVVIGDWF